MRTTFTLLALFMAATVWALPVDEVQARQKVVAFLSKQHKSGLRKRPVRNQELKKVMTNKACYVYNVGTNGGFVIASADDGTQPILAYGTEGAFNADSIPDGVKAWFHQLEQSMSMLSTRAAGLYVPPVERAAIAPLVATKWDQDRPYNQQCPTVNGVYTYTGCVATALAQIMYYHKYPTQMGSLPEYITTSEHIRVPALPSTTFNYDMMLTEGYAGGSTEEKAAVAKLMRYCGQALKMDYTTSYSGSNPTSELLINTFKFDVGLRRLFRKDYTLSVWDDIVYKEIAAHRPVMMGAYNFTGGHEFILDGYDGQGKYHVNWGWGGQANGYYTLYVLNPEEAGIGATALEDGFTLGQEIFVGLQPPTGTSTPEKQRLLLESFSTDKQTYTRSGGTFSVQFFAEVANKTSQTMYASALFNFYGEDGTLKNKGTYSAIIGWPISAAQGSSYSSAQPQRLREVDLDDGTYTLLCEYKLKDDPEIIRPLDCEKYALKVVVSGNTMTITPPDNLTKGLKINTVDIVGKKYLNTVQTVTVNATNEGVDNYPLIYALLNGKAVTGIGASIDPGTTGDAELHFTLTDLGTNTLKLCADIAGEKVLWEGTFEVYEEVEANLTGSMSFPDYVLGSEAPKKMAAPMLKMNLELTNENTVPYDSKVQMVLYKAIDMGDGRYSLEGQSYVEKSVYLDGKGKTVVSFEAPDVELGSRYAVRWRYFSKQIAVDKELSSIYEMVRTPFSVGGINYNITGDNTVEVTFRAPVASAAENGYSGAVTIPVAVTDPWGKTYGVTSIGEYAFFNATTLQKVVIPNSVKTIGDAAFNRCSQLDVYCLRPVAPVLGNNVFSSIDNTLHFTDEHSGYSWQQQEGSAVTALSCSDKSAVSFPSDGNPYECFVTRNMQRGYWNTLTLPFDVWPETLSLYFGEGTAVAVFDEKSTSNSLNFRTTTDVIKAGTPFLVKPSATGEPITGFAMAATLPATVSEGQVKSTDGSWTFMGLLAPKAIEKGTDCFLGAQNKYYLADGATPEELTVYGFRAYLHPSASAVTSKIGVPYYVDGTPVTTSIERVWGTKKSTSRVYDLQGRDLGTSSLDLLPKGIYIVNGKKVVKP